MKKVISSLIVFLLVLGTVSYGTSDVANADTVDSAAANNIVVSDPNLTHTYGANNEVSWNNVADNELESLSISGYELVPEFNPGQSNYYLIVPPDVRTLEVEAKTKTEGSTYSVSGDTTLNSSDDNVIKVRVIGDNDISKTYRITVVRSSETALKLSSLEIEGVTLEPEFNPNIFSYKASATLEEAKALNIKAETVIENAEIEILGNKDEELGQGTNYITILVKANGETTVYQIELEIKIEKVLITRVVNGIDWENLGSNIAGWFTWVFSDDTRMTITLSVGIVIILILIFLVIRKIRKYKNAEKSREKLKRRASK